MLLASLKLIKLSPLLYASINVLFIKRIRERTVQKVAIVFHPNCYKLKLILIDEIKFLYLD